MKLERMRENLLMLITWCYFGVAEKSRNEHLLWKTKAEKGMKANLKKTKALYTDKRTVAMNTSNFQALLYFPCFHDLFVKKGV